MSNYDDPSSWQCTICGDTTNFPHEAAIALHILENTTPTFFWMETLT